MSAAREPANTAGASGARRPDWHALFGPDADARHIARGPGRNEVALYIADTATWPVEVGPLQCLLDPTETARAARFRAARDRDRFIRAHALLRILLAGHVERDPAALRFATDAAGKPSLAALHAPAFSLAHSGDLVAIAVARRRAVGADIESARGVDDGGPIARRFFAAAENAALEALAPADRAAAFLIAWTRKEAALKARGTGIAGGLASVVTPITSTPGRAHAADGAGGYHVETVAVGDGGYASVAVPADAPPPVLHLVRIGAP